MALPDSLQPKTITITRGANLAFEWLKQRVVPARPKKGCTPPSGPKALYVRSDSHITLPQTFMVTPAATNSRTLRTEFAMSKPEQVQMNAPGGGNSAKTLNFGVKIIVDYDKIGPNEMQMLTSAYPFDNAYIRNRLYELVDTIVGDSSATSVLARSQRGEI